MLHTTPLRALTLSLLVWVAPSTAIAACAKLVAVGDDQVKTLGAKAKDAEEFDIETTLAFGRLLCAKRPEVRDYARRIGLASKKNKSIRSRALLSAVLELESVVLQVVEIDDMSEVQLKILRESPLISYGAYLPDEEKGCLSLYKHHKTCMPDYSVSVVGTRVNVRFQREVATLGLDDEGTLKGTWSNTGVKPNVSVPVVLPLD